MIQFDDILIRPLQASDASSLAQYANNERIAQNLRDRFPHPYTIASAESFIAFCQMPDAPPSFGIIKAGECVGVVGFIPQTDIHRQNAEFGYWLGEPFWGQGIMTNIIQKMTGYIFENYEISRLFATVFEFNTASQRVLQKAGFHLDCITRKSALKAGKLWDEYNYSLLAPRLRSE